MYKYVSVEIFDFFCIRNRYVNKWPRVCSLSENYIYEILISPRGKLLQKSFR